MPQTATQHDDKIRDLLLLGNPLDLLVSEGGKRGWTRADVLRVASENGWKLDPSGRVPLTDRARAQGQTALTRPTGTTPALAVVPPAAAAPSPSTSSSTPRLWAVLVAGQDHPVAAIKKKAKKLLEQLTELATAVEAAEEQRKALDRLAELDAERDRLRAALGKKPAKSTARPGDDAQARAWAKANGVEVTSRGRVQADVLEQWRKATSA
jgi:hypothetical protein